MADATMLKSENAIAYLISAGIVYEVIAGCCSSPQTTELNAHARSETLMKWVNLGIIQGAILIGVAAFAFNGARRNAILLGGASAGAMMYASYIYAKRSGLKNGGAPTERY